MFYASSSLDRADHLRKDDTMLQTLRSAGNSLLVPLWQGQSLVSRANDQKPAGALVLSSEHLLDRPTVFLGRLRSKHFFAVDISDLDEAERDRLCSASLDTDGMPAKGEFDDLRRAGPLLCDEDGSLLAYARGLIYWNSTTRFCNRCASELVPQNGGHVRRCINTQCGYLAFPRTDPAVIMLVVHNPSDGSEPLCLLGRSSAWPDGVFSTLAGFVEPGESLEMAVSREVLEESAIRTTQVKYVASQPWPFPRSIMLGFTAEATTTDIQCDPQELEDAQWFTRKQLENFGCWGDDTTGYKLPRTDSIARYLIDQWMQQA